MWQIASAPPGQVVSITTGCQIPRMKKYLRENCDYTFNTLKQNMPLALASVSILTIRKWEHRMIRWMEAYEGGLSAKNAQIQVKKFSSRQYKSHRRVPEAVAALFDA